MSERANDMTASPSTCLPAGQTRAGVGSPSLENVSDREWRRHQEVAYMFVRQSRHDMLNVCCALQMMEMVEKIQEAGPSIPLPPELQPDIVKRKVREALTQVVSMVNDTALLSQASNPVAYRSAHSMTVSELLGAAFSGRGEGTAEPSRILAHEEEGRVACLGDELQAALAAFYFQWTPGIHPHDNAAGATLERAPGVVRLNIPADDIEAVAAFARRLKEIAGRDEEPLIGNPLAACTTQSAFWLARFIVMIHGGCVTLNPDDPRLAIRVELPVIA